MSITLERLTETYLKYKSKHYGHKEDYFAPLFIADKFERKVEAVLPYCSIGKNEEGIEAYYIERGAKNLYLYHFEWGENFELFKDAYTRLVKDGIETIFGDGSTAYTGKLTTQLKMELEEYKDLINKVYICFVFNGDPESAESSKVLESLREELESKKHFIDQFFDSKDITLTIQYISNETKKINQTARTKKTFQYDIALNTPLKKIASGNEKMSLGFIHIFDLYKMHNDMKQRLFEKNIRGGLTDELAPNQAIKKSLRDIVVHKKVSPEYFTFHHNGVTLFAEKLEGEGGNIKIVEPRVLNGAQTITTLSRFIDDLRKQPGYNDYEKTLKKIEVIVKIITNCSQEFVTQVTISNNKQNPVEPWNLRANDMIQLEFDDKFRKDGIFYERQENSFANLSDADFGEMGIEQMKEVKIRKLAQTFLAVQGEVDKVSDMGKVFEQDAIYDKTFQKEFLKADTRKIILAYKIQFRIGAAIKEIESRGENKYFFVRSARNLVWALLIQGLFNEENIEKLLDNYGRNLSVETDFNSLVKETATKKIRMILSELIEQKKYEQYMLEERYGFLKTKNTFIECMAIARKRFGWEVMKLKD